MTNAPVTRKSQKLLAQLRVPSIPLLLGFCVCAALAQTAPSTPEAALATPPSAQVIPVTPAPGDFSEPSIAIDPNDPQKLVAAYQVNASVAYSRDGGKTWTIAEGTAATDYRRSGDVSVAYDDHGRAFLCYIAFDKLGTTNYWARGATRNGIFVRRSSDGGKTWDKEPSVVIAQPTEPNIPFEDKPYLAADTTHSKYAGNLYIGWTEFTLSKTRMLFARSIDGGKSWSKPIEVSTKEGLPRDDNGAVEGFTGAVDSDGTLYVVWCDISGIVLAVSHDGGVTFSPSRTIVKTGPSYFDPDHVFRGNGFPEIGVNPRNNELYVSWSDYTNGDIDVFVASSKDHGKRWSDPVRVNNDAVHNGHDHFFQWLAVDPVEGSVNVIFCDRRTDPANRSYFMVLARSTDGGETFKNYAWSTKPSDPSEVFMGDYMGIAANAGKVYGVWTRTAQPDEYPIQPLPKETTDTPKDAAKEPAKETERKDEKAVDEKVPMKLKGLIIEVGVADFSNTK
jgi:hypothetical protein